MKTAKKLISDSADLAEFRNEIPEKLDPWITTVYLEKRHSDFIESEDLNLSKLVRALLDGLMAQKYNDPDKTET